MNASGDTLWDELGIAPTRDSAAIKSAYAVRLKVTRPDDDPEGFQRLRTAYSAALRLAAALTGAEPPIVRLRVDNEPPMRETPEPLLAPDPSVVESLRQQEQTILSLRQVFPRGDGEAAVTAIEEAITRQTLPIDVEHQFVTALVGILLKDRAIGPRRLREIAERFGWYGVPDQLRGPNGWAEQRLCARIDAETWCAALKADAASWKYWIGQSAPAAARLLLGTEPTLLNWVAPPHPPLAKRLAEAQLYAPHLDAEIDLERVSKLRRSLLTQNKLIFRATRSVLTIAILLCLALVVGLYIAPQGGVGEIVIALVWFRFGGALIRQGYRVGLIFPILAVGWVFLSIVAALAGVY